MLINRLNWRDASIFYQTDPAQGAPVVPPATPPVAANEPPTSQVEEPFDRERAMATIANLRKFEADAKRLQKEVDAAKKAEDDRKTAELTEVEKANKKATDAQAALDSFKQRHRTTAIKSAIRLAAATAGFVDPEDAVLNLADNTSIELGDDDAVIGAKEAVEKLAKDKPHLLAATKLTPPNINATQSGAPRSLTAAELVAQRRDTDTIYQPF